MSLHLLLEVANFLLQLLRLLFQGFDARVGIRMTVTGVFICPKVLLVLGMLSTAEVFPINLTSLPRGLITTTCVLDHRPQRSLGL